MDFIDIKKRHILDYLQETGHRPVKTKYGSAWYQSPLRQEKTPSFKVDLNKNLWYDFGTGEGGNLIDLVIKLNNYSVPEALAHIGGSIYRAGEHCFEPLDDSCRIKIDRIQELSNPALIQYLRSRKILMPFGRRFLKEAYYTAVSYTHLTLPTTERV